MNAIILDWSGTIADDRAAVLESINRIFAHYDRNQIGEDEFRERFRLPYIEFYQEALPDIEIAEIEQRYVEFFPGDDWVNLLPGALEFLESVKNSGRKIFALTSVPEEHFHRQARRLGVLEYFDQVYAEAKDKSEVIQQLLDDHDLTPADTAFVGDMVHDIETGKGAGVVSVAVFTGYDPPERLLAAEPDLAISDLRSLARSLEAKHPNDASFRPIATVGALIFDPSGENILLVRTHKWSHKWGIPGGKIELGETSVEALLRETKEETDLDLTDIQFVFLQEAVDPPEFMRPAHFLLLNFVATATGRDVTLNDEAEEFLWVPFDAAYEFDLNQPTKTLIEEVEATGLQPRPKNS